MQFDIGVQPKKQRRIRGRRPGRLLTIFTVIYGLVLLTISAANFVGPERWWLASLNLYMPQWPWALPCGLLVPWYLLTAWRFLWAPALLLVWVCGPIMGLSLGLARFAHPAEGVRLRVMTYNVKWGDRDAERLVANVAAANPDVVIMQDSGGVLRNKLAALRKRGWSAVQRSQFSVLSRFPISGVATQWLTPARQQDCLRCVLHVGQTPVTLYNVHLMTPRWALGAVAESGSDAAHDVQQNADVRLHEAAGLAEKLATVNGPCLIAGDLNAPVQSLACQTLLNHGLKDAYSEAGCGYGYTYGQSTLVRCPFVRIDHVLVSAQLQVVRCSAGSPDGSDHSPVIADLLLPNLRLGSTK